MNDPHVASVHYRLEFGDGTTYSPPSSPLTFTRGDFVFKVSGSEIVLTPTAHFPTRDSALAVAEPIVRAWQLEAAIKLRVPRLKIEYQRTELIDRAPTPGVINGAVEIRGVASATATASIVRHVNEHPPVPDQYFELTADVESLWQRYVGFRDGREPLLSMAYFCLTVLESRGGRTTAAVALNVDEAVLRKVGELTSTRGDLASARKASRTLQPLSAKESSWLIDAIPALIIQLGRSAKMPSPIRLDLSDLPSL
jgi:hypothetical protein